MILQAICLFNLNSIQDLILSDVNIYEIGKLIWINNK